MNVRALIGAIGKSGTGKSHLLSGLARRCRRLLVADPEGTWALRPGDELVEGARALFAVMRRTAAQHEYGPFHIVYHDTADRMAWAAPAVAWAVQNCTLYYDEGAWASKGAGYAPAPFVECIQYGRKRGVNILYTTRDPQEVYYPLLTQANRLYFFRMDPGPGFTRVKRDWPQYAARLPQLREFPDPQHPAEFIAHGDDRVEQLLGREGLDIFRSPLLPSSAQKP